LNHLHVGFAAQSFSNLQVASDIEIVVYDKEEGSATNRECDELM
jgi:hypothetical protein